MRFQGLIAVLMALCLSACNLMGPRAVRSGRLNYNDAVIDTWSEQMLLNLVRLKYRDPPYFLEVSNVSTQYEFNSHAVAKPKFDFEGGNGLDGDLGIRYIERPTITYTPLQGEKFSRQLMSPLAFDTLLLLASSGWGMDRVLRCCVQGINDVLNAPRAAGPTPAVVPTYRDFKQVSQLLRELYFSGSIRFHLKPSNGSSYLVLEMLSDKSMKNESQELKSLLGLKQSTQAFQFVNKYSSRAGESIFVHPRSLLGVLFFLSQGVQVPESDRQNGKVTITRDSEGKEFDWSEVTGDLLRIKSREKYPNSAAVAVRYRSHWFYIDDSDLVSKSTFVLLGQLFSLQAGEVNASGPTLTLPLGG